MQLDKRYFTIFLIQVTEVLGFSLILPFLPFFAQDLGASTFQVGLIFAVFSFFQFFSTPILGKFSDYYGRKPLLIISQFSTLLGFIILGFAHNYWMIILSRIIDGLFGSNFTIAQAYLSDISTKKNRSKAFGLSGVAFGIGFLIGPGISGLLSQYGYSLPSFVAAGIAGVSMLLTFFVLPETITNSSEHFIISWKIFGLNNFVKYFKNKALANRMIQFWLYIFGHMIWVTSFALFAKFKINATATLMGYAFMYIGFISIFIRGLFLSKLIHLLGERKLKFLGMISMIIGLINTIFIYDFNGLLVSMTFFSVGTGISRPLLVSSISRQVNNKEQGAVLGLNNSFSSIAQIIAPICGGYILQNLPIISLGIIDSIIILGAIFLFIKSIRFDNNSGIED